MEKKIAVACSAFLENEKNQFLFLKRAESSSWGKNQWQLAEGKMEWGESPEQTIEREIMEETNCKAQNLKFIGYQTVNIQAKGNDYHVLILNFKGKLEGKIKLSEEHSEFAWWELKESLKENLVVGLKEFINENFL